MTFTVALMIAVSYWGARNVQTPCHPTTRRASAAQLTSIYGASFGSEVYMFADVTDCRIGISRMAADDRYWMPSFYCSGVVHEVGHIDGLTHAYGGVMRADGAGHIPWACEHKRKFLRHWRATH